ncbi:uncharacterized protein [Medicago truncatula]|uniref:Uncharacterized protein n=1 Tax=Medicago truncatula TaxID=3880 RepID=G7KG80_MEDTR|nr:uncharacterized protein LOC11443117 [Medicago truncatula]AES94208.1 hypothetical protein MTR_5g011930 [Medicago truncatula]
MENNKKQTSSPSSTTVNFDQPLSPKDSICPSPPSVEDIGSRIQEVGKKSLGTPGEATLFSSSILYGGREDDTPIGNTAEPCDVFKKDTDNADLNCNNPNSASRGDWWLGSLYY